MTEVQTAIDRLKHVNRATQHGLETAFPAMVNQTLGGFSRREAIIIELAKQMIGPDYWKTDLNWKDMIASAACGADELLLEFTK